MAECRLTSRSSGAATNASAFVGSTPRRAHRPKPAKDPSTSKPRTRLPEVDPATSHRVGTTPATRDVEQLELFERRRQRRVDEQAVADRLQSQESPQEQQRSASRPRLGTARRRVLDRELRLRPRVPCERLGKAAMEVLRRLQNSHRNPCGFVAISVTPQTPRDEGVVERPYGPDVIADGVVAALARGHGADAPSREELVAEQVIDTGASLVLVDDPAPEQVPDVRSERIDLALLAVEGQGKELALGDPVVRVEAPLEIGGLGGEALGRPLIAPDLAREPGAAALGIVGIPLELAGGARQRRQRTVGERDRIP